MLAIHLLAGKTECSSWGVDEHKAWLVTPSLGSDEYLPLFFRQDASFQWEVIRDWLSVKRGTCVSYVPLTVAEAFRKGKQFRCEMMDYDFLVKGSFNGAGEERWCGGKWKSVRADMRKTKAVPVVPTLEEFASLDALWAKQWTEAGKKNLSFRRVHKGDRRSQIQWIADNQKYLSDLGIRWNLCGWSVDGVLASAQMFTPITGNSFYSFSHRMDKSRAEGFMCFEEMDRAFQLPCYHGQVMNDGNAIGNTNLRLRKEKYSYGRLNHYRVTYAG